MNWNTKTFLISGVIVFSVLVIVSLAIVLFQSSEEDKPTNTDVIYGDKKEEYEVTTEHTHGSSKDSEVVFEETKNVANETSYVIDQPSKVEEALIPKFYSELLVSKDNKVYWISENKEILYYDSESKEVMRLVENISSASVSEDHQYLLFEQKSGEEFQTYQYDLNNPEFGFEHLLGTEFPLHSYGKANDFFYFSTRNNPDDINYIPAPRSSVENQEISYNALPSFDYLSQNGNSSFLGFKESDNAIYKVPFGKSPIQIQKTPDLPINEVVHLYGNPFKENRYVLTMAGSEEYPYGQTMIYNGAVIEEAVEIDNVQWIDQKTIIYNDASHDASIYLYNFDTEEKHRLANNVISFVYDYEKDTLYFLSETDPHLHKMSVTY